MKVYYYLYSFSAISNGLLLVNEWEQGALDISPAVTAKSRVAETLKRSVGLSDTRKPRKVKKAVYRNSDKRFSHKTR
jgi:RNase P protein component